MQNDEVRNDYTNNSETILFCGRTCAEAHLRGFFAPKCLFILPFPGVLRAFSEGLPVRDLRTESRNEEAQRKVGWELAGDF